MADLPPDASDDLTIADDCRLLRRVPPHWTVNGKPDSSNFIHPANEISGWSCTLWDQAEHLLDLMHECEGFGAVRITAGDLRQEGLQLIRVPLPENPTHCEVFGPMTSKGKARRLRDKAVWVVYPPSIRENVPTNLEAFE